MKNWFAFIGQSEKALRGGVNYFEDEKSYKLCFRSIPNSNFWENFAKESYRHKGIYFDAETPDVYQFLLSSCIGAYIDSQKISYKKNRDQAIARGKSSNDLVPDELSDHVSVVEIDNYLSSNHDYRLNRLIHNARELIIELFSFTLTRRYGPLSGVTASNLLNIDCEKSYVQEAFNVKAFEDEDKDRWMPYVYGFIRYVLSQYMILNDAKIIAAPRLKSFLAQRATINELRKQVVYYSEYVPRETDLQWKKPNLKLMESLPALP